MSKSLSRALASSVWLEKWSTGESHLLLLLLLLLLSTVTVTLSVRSSLAEVAPFLCAAAAAGVCLKKSAFYNAASRGNSVSPAYNKLLLTAPHLISQ